MKLAIMFMCLTAVAVCAAPAGAQFVETTTEEIVEFERQPDDAPRRYFDQRHDASWVPGALAEVGGGSVPAGLSTQELAQRVLAELNKLPQYGQKQTAGASNAMTDWVDHIYSENAGKGASHIRPAIPEWFLDGYSVFAPATVSRSRYLSGVQDGTLAPNADIAALYAYWTLYDAEWFSVSRKPAFKAWLSAVALHYPPRWIELQNEGQASLHQRLVAPLQTPDEPYREIDNWINNFTSELSTGQLGAFIKPTVRDGLVQELIARAGMEADDRFFEQSAYQGGAPAGIGLSDRQFFLLAALTLEYFQEIYALAPDNSQPLHFRDYFVSSFYGAR